MNSLIDCVFIIRSAGERTTSICKSLLLKEGVPRNNIHIIRERPFKKALKVALGLGLSIQLPFTCCIDADVLIRPGALQKCLQIFRAQSTKTFRLQGLVLDKFFGGARYGGVHLYKTCYLSEFLKSIPKNKALRPEKTASVNMVKKGFILKKINFIVGLHDFEQSYKNIYEKNFFQANKTTFGASLLIPFWLEALKTDNDYKVAFLGFIDGLQNKMYEPGEKNKIVRQKFLRYKINEKQKINKKNINQKEIMRILKTFKVNPFYQYEFPSLINFKKSLEEKNFFLLSSLSLIPKSFLQLWKFIFSFIIFRLSKKIKLTN